uniref:Uncharacterized protein n=1 Tax=Cacopsylla melanoneura TaxID=428564 RepID=A0A8D8RIY4_9HEMI
MYLTSMGTGAFNVLETPGYLLFREREREEEQWRGMERGRERMIVSSEGGCGREGEREMEGEQGKGMERWRGRENESKGGSGREGERKRVVEQGRGMERWREEERY